MTDMDESKEDSAIAAWLEEKQAVYHTLSGEVTGDQSRRKAIKKWLVLAYNFGRSCENDKNVLSYNLMASKADCVKRALQMYGRHMDYCPARPRFLRVPGHCTCGLDSLRK